MHILIVPTGRRQKMVPIQGQVSTEMGANLEESISGII